MGIAADNRSRSAIALHIAVHGRLGLAEFDAPGCARCERWLTQNVVRSGTRRVRFA